MSQSSKAAAGEERRGGLAVRVTEYRWVICGLLFFATTINYMDRQVFSLLKGMLDRQFGWTNEEFGVVNGLFQAAYAVGLLAFGWIVDRVGPKAGYALSIAGWSLAACGHGLVRTVAGFKAARVSLGLSEAGNFPSAVRAVAEWFPIRERALATALFNAGANAGPILAPLIVPVIAYRWGWRAAFAAIGAAGFLWLVVWGLVYERPERSRRVSAAELALIRADDGAPAATGNTSWLKLLRHRQTWSFIVGKALTDPVWWFFLIWLPDYFAKSRHLDIRNSRLHLASIYAICTVLSIGGGWLPGFWQKRGWSVTASRKASMFLSALTVLPVMAVTAVPSNWGAVLLIGLAAASHQAWSANLYTTVSDMFPKAAVASVIGLGGAAGSLTGVFFPQWTGRLLDVLPARRAYPILFGVCGCAYLIAFACHHLLAPSFAPVQLETTDDRFSGSHEPGD